MESYFDEILKEDPREVEIQKQIEKETDEFEATPEYKAHNERLMALWKEGDKIRAERFNRRIVKRRRHYDVSPNLTPEQEEERERKWKAEVEERRRREWEELDPEMKAMILKYREFSKSEKRKFNNIKEDDRSQNYDEFPKAKTSKLTKDDMRDLERVLVQTTIDFLKERSLDDVNEVHWGADGLLDSVKRGEWTCSTDSSIWFGGYEHEEGDKYGYRTFIGEYM